MQGFPLRYQVRMYNLLRKYIKATSPENMLKEQSALEDLIRVFHVEALMLIAEINNPEGFRKLAEQVETDEDN